MMIEFAKIKGDSNRQTKFVAEWAKYQLGMTAELDEVHTEMAVKPCSVRFQDIPED